MRLIPYSWLDVVVVIDCFSLFPTGLIWAFQLPVVRELFNNYVDTCFYDLMESLPEHHKLDFIR